MRTEMAAGAHLGLIGADADARRLASLKGGRTRWRGRC